jgi:thiamine biosynthesis protein ThiS
MVVCGQLEGARGAIPDGEDRFVSELFEEVDCRVCIQVVVNGQQQSLAKHTSIRQLLESLKLNQEQVAVEVDLEIIRREDWSGYQLYQGAKIEIVHFVGGGGQNHE